MRSFEILRTIGDRCGKLNLKKILGLPNNKSNLLTKYMADPKYGSGLENPIDRMHALVTFVHREFKDSHVILTEIFRNIYKDTPYEIKLKANKNGSEYNQLLNELNKEQCELIIKYIDSLTDGNIDAIEAAEMLKELSDVEEKNNELRQKLERTIREYEKQECGR